MDNVWRAQLQVVHCNCELGWPSQQLQQSIVICFVSANQVCVLLGSIVWFWLSLVSVIHVCFRAHTGGVG